MANNTFKNIMLYPKIEKIKTDDEQQLIIVCSSHIPLKKFRIKKTIIIQKDKENLQIIKQINSFFSALLIITLVGFSLPCILFVVSLIESSMPLLIVSILGFIIGEEILKHLKYLYDALALFSKCFNNLKTEKN